MPSGVYLYTDAANRKGVQLKTGAFSLTQQVYCDTLGASNLVPLNIIEKKLMGEDM
jgi:hypothetical protein